VCGSETMSLRSVRPMSLEESAKVIGKGFEIAFAPAAGTATIIPAGGYILFNKIVQFNADLPCCKCTRKPFAHIPLNDTRIELGLRGIWQLNALIDFAPAAGAQFAFTDNEGNVINASTAVGNTSVSARVTVYEDFMIVKLRNTGTVAITLTQGTDPTNNLVVVTGTYVGV